MRATCSRRADPILAEFKVMLDSHSDLARAHGVQLGRTGRTRMQALGYEAEGRRLRAAATFIRGGSWPEIRVLP